MISATAAAGGGADSNRLLHRQTVVSAYQNPGEAWRNRPPPPGASGRPPGAPETPPVEHFLRPAPKPLAPAVRSPKEALAASQVFFNYSRYTNGLVGASPNGTRIAPSRPVGKYPSPPSGTIPGIPVNLAKEEPEELSPYQPYRLFGHTFPHFSPYTSFQQPFLLRGFPPTPLSPQELFAASTPTGSTSQTFLTPANTFSPPTSTIVKPKEVISNVNHKVPLSPNANFKVPSGKEGSLKHRILTRPEDLKNVPLDLQNKTYEGRKRLQATLSPPPRSPSNHKRTVNNNTLPSNFAKGSLIQLVTGEYKKIEDMRTEDFVMSAEKSSDLRLAESTVLKIEETTGGTTMITLTYNQRKSQVDMESPSEHPYFVIGRGWASRNPEKSHRCFGLRVHKLEVGDVIVSLTPREPKGGGNFATNGNALVATTKQVADQGFQMAANRKRRWSAPDQLEEEEESSGKQRLE